MSACYLLAFLGGVLVQGTSWAWVGPYIDPAILAFVCVLVMIAPLGTVRRALAGILLVTPPELQAHVDAVARAIVAKHGFVEHRSYVAQVGRGEQIELFFVVPETTTAAGGMGPAARRDRRRAGRGLAGPLADHHVHHRPRVDDLGRQDDRSSFRTPCNPTYAESGQSRLQRNTHPPTRSIPMSIEKVLYTAQATSTGREGRSVSSDNVLDIQLSTPRELGGASGRHQPRTAVRGWLLGLLPGRAEVRGRPGQVALPADTTVTGKVGIGQIPTGFGIEAELTINVPGVPREQVEELVQKAHIVCPY